MSKRNEFVDVMRGVAILLVVLGHTMTGCTANSESSFLYNVIWSIQMPLFFLISGYVTKYSKSIKTTSDLCNYIKRRSIAYMWPWLIWSFLVRGIIFGQSYFLNVKFLFWHMDTGYWFLASIWTISIAFGISSFFAEKSNDKSDGKYMIRMLIFYLLCMIALLGIGLSTGLSFFAIKQTLYYMPFYFAGFLWGRYQDNIMSIKWGKACISILVALCLGVWLYIMVRYNIYTLPDSGMAIIFRAITSLCGCVALCGLCKGIYKSSTAFGGGTLVRSSFTRTLSQPLSVPESSHNRVRSCGERAPDFNNNDKLCDYGNFNSTYSNNRYEKQCSSKDIVLYEVISKMVHWAGKRSLEIYLIHGLALTILKTKNAVIFPSALGYALVFTNFLITLAACYFIIDVISCNEVLRKSLSIRPSI